MLFMVRSFFIYLEVPRPCFKSVQAAPGRVKPLGIGYVYLFDPFPSLLTLALEQHLAGSLCSHGMQDRFELEKAMLERKLSFDYYKLNRDVHNRATIAV